MANQRDDVNVDRVTEAGNGDHRSSAGAAPAGAAATSERIMTEGGAESANRDLVNHMSGILDDARKEANELRRKLKWTYWIVVTLSVMLFLVGLALVSMPVWSLSIAVDSRPDLGVILASVGVGFADFAGLFVFNPIARVQKLMGDISQITALFSAYQIRVALRLVETNSEMRKTMGDASVHIGKVAEDTLKLIEQYYEEWLLPDLRQPETA